jgi:hypothetical protein
MKLAAIGSFTQVFNSFIGFQKNNLHLFMSSNNSFLSNNPPRVIHNAKQSKSSTTGHSRVGLLNESILPYPMVLVGAVGKDVEYKILFYAVRNS